MTDVMLKVLTERPLKARCFIQAAFQTATYYMHAHAHTGIKQQAEEGWNFSQGSINLNAVAPTEE